MTGNDRLKTGMENLSNKSMEALRRGYEESVSLKIEERVNQPSTVQRLINTVLPTRWYRRKDGSASSKINQKIKKYNADLKSGATDEKKLEEQLEEILKLLKGINKQSKQPKVKAIREEIEKEQKKIKAVRDVMELARKRAQLQKNDPKIRVPVDSKEANDYMESLEVLHATNPLKVVGEGRFLGDDLAESEEIKNIHQVGHSLIGGHKDSPKRKTAEIGTFYPQKYRRDSFNRIAHKNPSETKGINQDILPPAAALPKYGAVNMVGSDFGALEGGLDVPLHFAIDPKVLEKRTTFTSGDSLREWFPDESNYKQLNKMGIIGGNIVEKADTPLPEDEKAWDTGPIATYGSKNFSQLLPVSDAKAYVEGKSEENPLGYIEAQVHGEVFIERDITHVRANFAKLFGNPGFKSLYVSLLTMNKPIKWYWKGKQREEGNKLTQGGKSDDEKHFDRAWKEAEKLWKKNNEEYDQFVKDDKVAEGDVIDLKENGTMLPKFRRALYEIWKELVSE